jgi:HSP20 family molecular chaperone IbpA
MKKNANVNRGYMPMALLYAGDGFFLPLSLGRGSAYGAKTKMPGMSTRPIDDGTSFSDPDQLSGLHEKGPASDFVSGSAGRDVGEHLLRGTSCVRPVRDNFGVVGISEKKSPYGINIYSSGEMSHIVKMLLPGIDVENVNVTADGAVLSIKIKDEPELSNGINGLHCFLREIAAIDHNASRVIAFPYEIDTSKISCTLKNGVLEIVVFGKTAFHVGIESLPIKHI